MLLSHRGVIMSLCLRWGGGGGGVTQEGSVSSRMMLFFSQTRSNSCTSIPQSLWSIYTLYLQSFTLMKRKKTELRD